ncbi:MAG: hypothetical protein E6H64_17680 [Betaproteobacteria bacterium]|nr:MAG: hypothetical protein E6H64_17680 [Betaproteobacteria bacterium]
MARGLILFAHGSREPGWAEPFEQLAARVRVAAPQALGQGGHLRRDLPLLVNDLRAQFPEAKFAYARAAGDDAGVLDAIAAYCVGQLGEG